MHSCQKAVVAFIAIAGLPFSTAQVSTSCQPLTATCPNDEGLTTSSYFIDFTTVKSQPSDWTLANYEYVEYGSNGAEFRFAKRYDAPTMHSNFKFFFGRIEYVAKMATGKGIVSSMVLLSDDLDEIDWECTGTGGNNIETNYFGKGVLNYGVAKYVSVTNPQSQYHTYALDWSPTQLVWSIDGVTVRTLTPAEAGNEYPQTPMAVSLSLWDGGDPDSPQGTRDWAGGLTPIPPPENYTMYIKSVKIQNTNPAFQYQYTDRSGSYQSIKVIKGPLSSSRSSTFSSSSTSASIKSSSSSSTSLTSLTSSIKQSSSVSSVTKPITSLGTTSSTISSSKPTPPISTSGIPTSSVVSSTKPTSATSNSVTIASSVNSSLKPVTSSPSLTSSSMVSQRLTSSLSSSDVSSSLSPSNKPISPLSSNTNNQTPSISSSIKLASSMTSSFLSTSSPPFKIEPTSSAGSGITSSVAPKNGPTSSAVSSIEPKPPVASSIASPTGSGSSPPPSVQSSSSGVRSSALTIGASSGFGTPSFMPTTPASSTVKLGITETSQMGLSSLTMTMQASSSVNQAPSASSRVGSSSSMLSTIKSLTPSSSPASARPINTMSPSSGTTVNSDASGTQSVYDNAPLISATASAASIKVSMSVSKSIQGTSHEPMPTPSFEGMLGTSAHPNASVSAPMLNTTFALNRPTSVFGSPMVSIIKTSSLTSSVTTDPKPLSSPHSMTSSRPSLSPTLSMNTTALLSPSILMTSRPTSSLMPSIGSKASASPLSPSGLPVPSTKSPSPPLSSTQSISEFGSTSMSSRNGSATLPRSSGTIASSKVAPNISSSASIIHLPKANIQILSQIKAVPILDSQSTQEVVTTEIVHTTVTSCPVTSTITPVNGKPTQQIVTVLSTVFSTSISTVCTKCVAPVASSYQTGTQMVSASGSGVQSAATPMASSSLSVHSSGATPVSSSTPAIFSLVSSAPAPKAFPNANAPAPIGPQVTSSKSTVVSPVSSSSMLATSLKSSTRAPAMLAGSLVPPNGTSPIISAHPTSPQSTLEVITTEIVTSYVTTCPVISTTTSGGSQITKTGSTVSTIYSTITSTVCTKCVAPHTPAPSLSAISLVAGQSPPVSNGPGASTPGQPHREGSPKAVVAPSNSAASLGQPAGSLGSVVNSQAGTPTISAASAPGAIFSVVSTIDAKGHTVTSRTMVAPAPSDAKQALQAMASSAGLASVAPMGAAPAATNPPSSMLGHQATNGQAATPMQLASSSMLHAQVPQLEPSHNPDMPAESAAAKGQASMPNAAAANIPVPSTIIGTVSTTDSNGSPIKTQMTTILNAQAPSTIVNVVSTTGSNGHPTETKITTILNPPAPSTIISTVSTTDSKGHPIQTKITTTLNPPAPSIVISTISTTDSKGNPITTQTTKTLNPAVPSPIISTASTTDSNGHPIETQITMILSTVTSSPVISTITTTDAKGSPTVTQVTVTPTIIMTVPAEAAASSPITSTASTTDSKGNPIQTQITMILSTATSSPVISAVPTTDAKGSPIVTQVTVTPTIIMTVPAGTHATVTSQRIVASLSSTATAYMMNSSGMGNGSSNGSSLAYNHSKPAVAPLTSPIAAFQGNASRHGFGALAGLVIVALVMVFL